MTRNLLVGAIAVGALAITTGTAFALSSNDGPTSGAASVTSSLTESTNTSTTSGSPTSTSDSPTNTAAPGAGSLSAADAGRIAQERLGGTVRGVEREVEHGRLEWKVAITARDGNSYDVRIDAQSGAITRIDQNSRGGNGVADDRGTSAQGTDVRGTDDNSTDDNGTDDNSTVDNGTDDHGGHGSDDTGVDDHGGHGGDDN
jgi:hypothetical protein